MRFKAGQPISLEPGNYKVRAIGSADFPPQDGRFDNDIWQDVEITSDKRRYLVNPVVRPLPGSIWENVDFINPSSFVAYGNGVWLVTNTGFRTTISRSADDGLTWEIIDTELTGSWRSIAYGDGAWIMLSASGVQSARSMDDGLTWTPISSITNNGVSIAYGNGTWVVVIQNNRYGRRSNS